MYMQLFGQEKGCQNEKFIFSPFKALNFFPAFLEVYGEVSVLNTSYYKIHCRSNIDVILNENIMFLTPKGISSAKGS